MNWWKLPIASPTGDNHHRDILYKCGWSPLEGYEFGSRVRATPVNGEVVWLDGRLSKVVADQRLEFS